MKLSSRARKRLAERKKLTAMEVVVSRDARDVAVTTSAPVTLKRKKGR